MRGANLRARVHISFEDAVFGCEKELEINLKEECETCHGSGAKPGTSKTTCSRCGGQGRITATTQSLFGTMQRVMDCPDCGGSGQMIKDKCTSCNGSGYVSKRKKISVSIPAGIDNGQAVRIREKGEPGANGGPRGDLLVEVVVAEHPDFVRNGYDIYSQAKISFPVAVLGGDTLIDTLDGQVSYEVKAGTQTGTRIRLRGKGVPSLRNKAQRGDQYVTLVVDVPTNLSRDAKDALRDYDALAGASLSGGDLGAKKKKKKGFFS